MVDEDFEGKIWWCTSFYGAPEEKHREALWNLMRHLNNYPNVPQFIIEDFNEISYSSEKKGELVRSERQMRGFRDVLVDCSLTDLGYCGQWFTWEKCHFQENNIRERLDQGVLNDEWWTLSLNYQLNHLAHSFSDYCPLPVNTNMHINSSRVWHFKFEDAWLVEDSYESEVKNLWATSVVLVPSRLREVGLGLDK
ncbi:hypothetical protein GOBAR_DD31301 [Gossypium barbadense]|nr:hypothetical protein GOBAR_DD31301 [Gossypium barbadense]